MRQACGFTRLDSKPDVIRFSMNNPPPDDLARVGVDKPAVLIRFQYIYGFGW